MAAMEAPRCPNRLIACTHRIYEAGANKLDDVLDWCGELGIRAVTLCLFSTENLKRPADEVPGIFQQFGASSASSPTIPKFTDGVFGSRQWVPN